MDGWTELEQGEIQQGTKPVRVQPFSFYPASWWRWEIRHGKQTIMMSRSEARHFTRLVMEQEQGFGSDQ